jgi:lysophospholipase L1-like esterase
MSIHGSGEQHPVNGKRTRVLPRLALLLGGILVALVLAEGLVRIGGFAPEVALIQKGRFRLSSNPKIGYEPAPGLNYEGDELAYYDYRGRSNSLGYRDTEHSVAKAPGVYRILILGDSVAAGLDVLRYEDTFPAILGERLRQSGVPAEVLSFAVSGYNTAQEVETLKDRGLRFEPDLILLAYCLNDSTKFDGGILDMLLAQEKERGGISLARANPYLMRSALYRLLYDRILPKRPAPAPNDVGQDMVEASFRELSALSRDHHFAVLVAVFPVFEDLRDYRHEELHGALRALSVKNGFEHIDLLSSFRQCADETSEPLAFDRLHPTERGHACAGAALANYIHDLARSKGWAGR